MLYVCTFLLPFSWPSSHSLAFFWAFSLIDTNLRPFFSLLIWLIVWVLMWSNCNFHHLFSIDPFTCQPWNDHWFTLFFSCTFKARVFDTSLKVFRRIFRSKVAPWFFGPKDFDFTTIQLIPSVCLHLVGFRTDKNSVFLFVPFMIFFA